MEPRLTAGEKQPYYSHEDNFLVVPLRLGPQRVSVRVSTEALNFRDGDSAIQSYRKHAEEIMGVANLKLRKGEAIPEKLPAGTILVIRILSADWTLPQED